jgi:O-methyltransferase
VSHVSPDDISDRYLKALSAALMGSPPQYAYRFVPRPQTEELQAQFDVLRDDGIELVTQRPPSPDLRESGAGWLPTGMTMLGALRLAQLRDAVETVVREGIEGDLIETGVWRGGATILMRGVLRAHGVTDRRVWVADSFQGLPRPDPERYPADEGDRLHEQPALAIPLEEVRANFAWHGLLDDQVRFVPGWFRDTLPSLAGHRWSVVRLDGDMYESTIVGLEHLYPGLSPGGFLIVDDYGAVPACRQAVEDFRSANPITETMHEVDWTAVYWRKR